MKHQIQIPLKDEQATEALAAMVARYTVCGDLIRLEGTLGMGKTTFARAFVRAMCADSEMAVPSPTFTLVQLYDEGRLPIAHVDAYRMSDPEEWIALDLDDYHTHGVTLLEWGEKVESALPEHTIPARDITESEFGDCLTVTLQEVEGKPDERLVTLSATGTWARRFGFIAPELVKRPTTPQARQAYVESVGYKGVELTALTQDASFRTYHRLELAEPLVLMDAPAPLENVATFVKLSDYYAGMGVHVPKIHHADVENGYLILEDFGNKRFATAQAEGVNMMPWLEAMVDLLADIANKSIENLPDAPRCDVSVPWQESQRYTDWYLPLQTGHATAIADRAAFKQIWENLHPALMKMPQVACHWDCHIDNIMMLDDTPCKENIGLIDYQDTVVGPAGIDLACLLEDRLKVTDAQREELIDRYLNALNMDVNKEDFMASYNLCLLFRFFKITGLLPRLELRDGREGATARMADIWATIDKTLQHPVTAPVAQFLKRMQKQEAA